MNLNGLNAEQMTEAYEQRPMSRRDSVCSSCCCKALSLPSCHPAGDVPNVREGLLGVGDGAHVAIPEKFWGQGGLKKASGLLRSPNQVPPALMGCQGWLILRRSRFADLGMLGKANAAMDVLGPTGAEFEDFPFTINQALADHAPMAEVAGELHGWKKLEQVSRHPRIE